MNKTTLIYDITLIFPQLLNMVLTILLKNIFKLKYKTLTKTN